MEAGESARQTAEGKQRHSRVLLSAAIEEARSARRYERGGAAEERTAALLAELTEYGFRVLHDRHWPGTQRANIDHVVAGPSGVFVVDTKHWAADVTVSQGRLIRGQVECDDEVAKVRDQAGAVRDVLVETGLSPTMVVPVIGLHGKPTPKVLLDGTWVVGTELLPREILRDKRALTPAQVDQVVAALERGLSAAAEPQPTHPSEVEAKHRAVPEDTLFSVDDLDQDALAAALKKPLADWMVFLHPSQARYARRDLNGAGRITGPAGTGKTVVALHRLAQLAETGSQRLLYVTFVRTIPLVLSHAYRRMSPHTADRVEFASLHAWAARLLRGRGLPHQVETQRCANAFSLAFARWEQRESMSVTAPYSYWKEEVDNVLRGRALTNLDDYLALNRAGRSTRLGHLQRRAVWCLAQHYESLLSARGLLDWNDLLRLARDEVRRCPPEPEYDAVVLDEAQDMPLLAGQLLQALVGNRPNGLMFVGDDQQRVFPGGFRLVECGVDVTGRSVRLTRNYRNTREILETAARLVDDQDVAMLDETTGGGGIEIVRTGAAPTVVRAGSQQEHDRVLVEAIRASAVVGTACAVLFERRGAVRGMLQVLRAERIPAVDLETWDGASEVAVIVGTIKRAKGLEFSRVFVPAVEPALLREPAGDLSEAAVHPADTTVAGVMFAVLGAVPEGGPARFREPGWSHAGQAPSLTCETCGSALHVCRRPYTSAGKEYRYWALVCPECLTCAAPDDLSRGQRKALARLRQAG